MYWHQRSRLNYLRFGGRHARFFHITATQRRQRNLILRLNNEREEWVTSPRGISDIHHFNSIFIVLVVHVILTFQMYLNGLN
ncbi:hypothetical protein RHMOL_Rhmol06G0094200 [Rhododendron molle]|uniref:Uncharacterized protein n=1 Tax=Rhododendron molle TaxID=49168 RepID=A0ACC0NCS8_RHOML|nr:hypothetical protein RHMOL_Rhmol06G0094200 [Rhododendron molle]